jgi:hypothetical protein
VAHKKLTKKLTLGFSLALLVFGVAALGVWFQQAGAPDVAAAQSRESAQQASILSDGLVSWDEHEAAIASTAECLTEAGVRVEIHPADGRKASSIGFAVGSLAEGDVAQGELADCKATYLDRVQAAWVQQQLAERDDPQAFLDAYLESCIESRGERVPDAPEGEIRSVFGRVWGTEPAPALADAFAACAYQFKVDNGG